MTITTRSAVMWEAHRDWEVVELELDDPRDHEVLIRFEASGLCHSDDHIKTNDGTNFRFPMVGGHEGAGVIEKVGSGVERVAVGDRVICSFIPVCGICRWCSTGHQYLCDQGLNAASGMLMDNSFRFHHGDEDLGGFCVLGTFSRRAVVSEYSCVQLPDDISFELGSILGCGVPTGWGSAVRAAKVQAGQTVVVYGSGGVGSNAVQGSALAGARQVVVVDPVPFKREMASVFGATHTFATHDEALDHVRDSTRGLLADHAIITVGLNTSETVDQAAAIIGKLGTVTVTAIGKKGEHEIDMPALMLQGYAQKIQGTTFGHCNPLSDLPILLDLYRDGKLKLDELITQRYTLDQVNDAYQDLHDGKNIRGVIIHTD